MPLTRIKNTAIGDGGISTAKLADGAVTTVKVADSAVNSAKIGVDVIAAEDLAANSVTVSEISDGAVTGAKLAANLNYDSGTLYLDSTNNRVAIGSASSLEKLRVAGNIEVYNDDADGYIWFHDAGTRSWAVGSVQSTGKFSINYNQNFSSAERLTIDTNGFTSLNTTTGNERLNVAGAIGSSGSSADFNAGDERIIIDYTGTVARIGHVNGASGSAKPLQFLTAGGTRMTLSAGGFLGIGIASPSQALVVSESSTPTIQIKDGAGSGTRVSGRLHIGESDTLGVSIENSTSSYNDNCAMVFKTSPAAGTITERMRIESSGNVKLTSPVNSTGYTEMLRLEGLNLSNGWERGIAFTGNSGGLEVGRISSYLTGAERHLRFTSAGALGMTIRENGSVLVGTSTIAGVGASFIPQAGNGQLLIFNQSYGNGFTTQQFRYNGTAVGGIVINTSSTAFNTSSDYRLKENVVTDWDATSRLKQLKPSRFNFIADADTTVDGFLAHEVQDIVPEAITGEKDAKRVKEYEVTPAVLDEDGNVVTPAVMGTRSVPDYQGIDQSKLVPLLVKSLQEALADIDTLKAEVTALKNA